VIDAKPIPLRESLSRVRQSSAVLQTESLVRRAQALSAAFMTLSDPHHPRGARLRRQCHESSGLHPAMVEWGLHTSIPSEAVLLEAIASLSHEEGSPHPAATPPSLGVIVLSGNVFTAAIRAISFPLLAGVPCAVKVSSRDGALALALQEAWAEVWPEAQDAVRCFCPPREQPDMLKTLLSAGDWVSAYGSDETVLQLAALSREDSCFVRHGHGLGLAYIPASALASDTAAQDWAIRLGVDLAAYDQRGCLSPHSVLVEEGAKVSARRFAEILFSEGIPAAARRLPRGPLPAAVAAEQLQWRGVAAACGTLHETPEFAVSFEQDGPLRASPGWRNLQVVAIDDQEHLMQRIAPLGAHLKMLGVAGEPDARNRLEALLPASVHPQVAPLGEMQTPSFGSLADGKSPWFGLR